MESILKYAPKPSDAVLAMINGLEEHSKREEFIVDMESFGMRRQKSASTWFCIGCAATCALQKLTGVTLTAENICGSYARANALGFTDQDMLDVEMMYESLRRGDPSVMYGMYGIPHFIPHFELPHMKTSNWREVLPKYKEYYLFLKKHRL